MKVPINQKFMLTITEASEYFGIGERVLRKFAADHQEISIRYGMKLAMRPFQPPMCYTVSAGSAYYRTRASNISSTISFTPSCIVMALTSDNKAGSGPPICRRL